MTARTIGRATRIGWTAAALALAGLLAAPVGALAQGFEVEREEEIKEPERPRVERSWHELMREREFNRPEIGSWRYEAAPTRIPPLPLYHEETIRSQRHVLTWKRTAFEIR